jgi:predicted ester cyclase
MTEQDRNIGSRWFDEVWNKKRRDAIAEMMTPASILHDGAIQTVGPDGFYPFFERIHNTFSEIKTTVHDTIAEGDKVCFRWSFEGRHSGHGLGLAPTDRKVSTTGMAILRVQNGKLIEAWQNWDMLGLLEQIKSEPRSATYVDAR